jgi:hypothetical protein
MIIFDVLYMFLHSKLSCSPVRSFYFFIYITLKTFGVRFFVAKMEAVSMEVVLHFFTNLYTLKSSNTNGFILGLIMTLYILAQIGLCIWVARSLVSLAEEQKSHSNPDSDIVSIKQDKQPDHRYLWRVISIMWVGMRADIGKHAVYYPIVSMIRMFLLGLIVGIFTEIIVAMSVLVIIIESLFIAYAIFSTKLRPRLSLIDNIVEFIGPFFNIIYHFFSAISTAESLEREGGYDTTLYALLLLFIVANLVLGVVSLVLAVFRLFKAKRQSSKVENGEQESKSRIISSINSKTEQVQGPGSKDSPLDMQEPKLLESKDEKLEFQGMQRMKSAKQTPAAIIGVSSNRNRYQMAGQVSPDPITVKQTNPKH